MSKVGLNTHVFEQSMFNWIPLPTSVGDVIELPIPPVKDMKEILVFINATFDASVTENHYYGCFTRALEGSPIPFHCVFLVGGIANQGGGCNSDNFWLRTPDEGLPRVVYIQKLSGPSLPSGKGLVSGATVLSMR